MKYLVVLDALIKRGVEAAKRDYAKRPWRLTGAVEGFEACRDKSPEELRALLAQAHEVTELARRVSVGLPEDKLDEAYWTHRCYELEVEWIANCVSVMLSQQGLPTLVPPTVRAAMAVARVVGVAAPD